MCPPDNSHVDWLTIPGATVEELLFAWQVEYAKLARPMRVLLVAGLNDLLKGVDIDSLTWQIRRFRTNVDYHNINHPGRFNSFAVAPLLPAPKFVWFADNGPHSSTYVNRRGEVEHINDWIRT